MRTSSSVYTVVLTALLWTESKSFSIQSQTRINKVKALHNSHSHAEGGVQVGENKENRLKKYGQVLLDRSDTMKAAGFHDICKENKDEYPPLQAGAKTNITLFLLALGYKWYRSIFINKEQDEIHEYNKQRQNETEALLKSVLGEYSFAALKDILSTIKSKSEKGMVDDKVIEEYVQDVIYILPNDVEALDMFSTLVALLPDDDLRESILQEIYKQADTKLDLSRSQSNSSSTTEDETKSKDNSNHKKLLQRRNQDKVAKKMNKKQKMKTKNRARSHKRR